MGEVLLALHMVSKLKMDELPCKMSDVTARFTAVNPANEKIVFGDNRGLHGELLLMNIALLFVKEQMRLLQ